MEDVNGVLVVGSSLLDGWMDLIIAELIIVEFGCRFGCRKTTTVWWLPQGYLSEFRVQTLDNPHYELIGYSIYLCHGRWTDCHISATSSHIAPKGSDGHDGPGSRKTGETSHRTNDLPQGLEDMH